MTNSVFKKGDLQFIYLLSGFGEIHNNTFEGIDSETKFGGALECACNRLNVTNNFFSNLTTAKGGALHMSAKFTDTAFILDNNTFSENRA